MIDPGTVRPSRVRTMLRVPGRDQSRGSTDQPSGRKPWAAHSASTSPDHSPPGALNRAGRCPPVAAATLKVLDILESSPDLRERVHGHRRVGEGGAQEGKVLLLLDQRLRHLRGLGFVGGVVCDRKRDLGAIDAAALVDLVDGQLHAVTALGPVDAARPGDRKDRAELDRLPGVRAARGGPAPARRATGSENDPRRQHGNKPNDSHLKFPPSLTLFTAA